ncbi:LANO_0H11848g1_1 [Lachancea nothofagi CBS 11611]|uniref:Palmitoyltransferase n=1 Tax=Lachancea nothofagi CBS 11611 TaxID=1266666 RepID=A0A1G4KM38_9SACH|nr:LANO_0H11848g1_1 [Lachancea nothofagi CBS 11611]
MRLDRHLWSRLAMPLIMFALLCYASWAYCHLLCYREIYRKFGHKSTAVGLMCGEVVLVILVVSIWVQLFALGPGKQPKILPFRILPDGAGTDTEEGDGKNLSLEIPDTIIPPEIYQCDPQGYPLWCTACKSIKANRTHHSSTLGYCVPRFDHYCMWIGTVVGRKNYRLFVQFALYLWCFCILVIASTASFLSRIIASRQTIPRVNPNILITFGLCCMATLMVGPLFMSHSYYMAVNLTSLEVIATKRRSKATKNWLCFLNPVDGLRYVFEFKAVDAQNYWDKKDILVNLKEFMGTSYWRWFLPVGANVSYHSPKTFEFEDVLGSYNEIISDRLRELLMDKISKGEYLATFRAEGDKFQSGSYE